MVNKQNKKKLEKSTGDDAKFKLRVAKIKLENAIHQEYLDAKQKSKCDWLLLDDEATSFFMLRCQIKDVVPVGGWEIFLKGGMRISW